MPLIWETEWPGMTKVEKKLVPGASNREADGVMGLQRSRINRGAIGKGRES